MKVLIVFDTDPATDNPFVRKLSKALRTTTGHEVVCAVAEFWTNAEAYDIIHLQWPEALFDWHWPTQEQVEALRRRLQTLHDLGKHIVYTRHNSTPHVGNERIVESYRIVERLSDAIVHMGEYSRREFCAAYPDSKQVQVVIPHHTYEGEYDTSLTQEQGRKQLHIPQNAVVVLAFGAFRHAAERKLVWGAFRRLRCKHKFLLASRLFPCIWRTWRSGFKGFLERLCYLAVSGATRFSPWRITCGEGLVPTQELPAHVSAADVILIQRTDILNSGNVTLGFAFGKVVVGPDRGNIGEALRLAGNPVFDPESPESVDKALSEAVRLAREGFGTRNREYALQQLSSQRIARLYGDLYEKLYGADDRK